MALRVRAYVAGESDSRVIDLDGRHTTAALSESEHRAFARSEVPIKRVFVSHYNEDGALAQKIAFWIRDIGMTAFLDIDDPNLPKKDDVKIADYIKGVINASHALVVVTSNKTVNSWWVPYEIGVADQKDLVLATYIQYNISLPSYLSKWPMLSDQKNLEYWCGALGRQGGKTLAAFYEALERNHPSIYAHRHTSQSSLFRVRGMFDDLL